MTTLSSADLTTSAAAVRRTLIAGDEVVLTFHGKPYARVISSDRLEQERAELASLRREVEALRSKLDGNQEVPAA